MIGVAVVLTLTAVLFATASGSSGSRIRLARLMPHGPPRGYGGGGDVQVTASHISLQPRSPLTSLWGQWAVCVFAGGCCAVAIGGIVGAALGVGAAVACARGLRHLEPATRRRRRQRLAAELPAAADLFAACLLAGTTLVDAAESVAAGVGGPMEDELRAAVASIRLGADPVATWLELAEQPALAPLGRTLARAIESGAPLAQTMIRLADDQREERRQAATALAQRVQVRATMPLGLCFLPAFVFLGVIPVVGGIASQVLGGLG